MKPITEPIKSLAGKMAAAKFLPSEEKLREHLAVEFSKVIYALIQSISKDLSLVTQDKVKKLMFEQWFYEPGILSESIDSRTIKLLQNFLFERLLDIDVPQEKEKLEGALKKILMSPEVDKLDAAIREEEKAEEEKELV